MPFYGKNLAQFVLMFGTQSYCDSEIPNEGSRELNGFLRGNNG